jgi:hypothetical protein
MSNLFPTMTEPQILQAQLADAQAELMRRDREAVQREIAALEKQKADDEARAAAETAEAQAKELEKCRASAWLNHKLDVALAAGNDAFVQLLSSTEVLNTVPDGWPPGTSAADFGAAAMPELPVEPAAINTRLGKLLFSSSGT